MLSKINAVMRRNSSIRFNSDSLKTFLASVSLKCENAGLYQGYSVDFSYERVAEATTNNSPIMSSFHHFCFSRYNLFKTTLFAVISNVASSTAILTSYLHSYLANKSFLKIPESSVSRARKSIPGVDVQIVCNVNEKREGFQEYGIQYANRVLLNSKHDTNDKARVSSHQRAVFDMGARLYFDHLRK